MKSEVENPARSVGIFRIQTPSTPRVISITTKRGNSSARARVRPMAIKSTRRIIGQIARESTASLQSGIRTKSSESAGKRVHQIDKGRAFHRCRITGAAEWKRAKTKYNERAA